MHTPPKPHISVLLIILSISSTIAALAGVDILLQQEIAPMMIVVFLLALILGMNLMTLIVGVRHRKALR